MSENPGLQKSFTLFGLTMIAVSASFGSGIFFSVSQTASHIPDKSWILLAWFIGGMISMAGALTFAELGSRFPQTGGVYIYLRETVGHLWAFLYGWCSLTVVTSGAIAALSAVFINNLDYFFHFSQNAKTLMGCMTILILLLINIFNNKFSEWIAGGLTVIKIAGVGVIIVCGFLFKGNGIPMEEASTSELSFLNLGIALVGVMWAYGGWHHTAALAGETHSARNQVPKAMIYGSLIITAIYMLTNWSYLELLTPERLAESKSPAAEAIGNITKQGSAVMAGLIAISVFATASIYTFTTPRIYYQMGVDGVFFKWIGKMHPKFKIPVRAMVIQSLWAVVLLIGWQTFSKIISYVTLTDWIFLTLAGAGLLLSHRSRNRHDGYKVPFYPWIPIVFVLMASAFVISVCLLDLNCAWICASFIGFGLLVYYIAGLYKFKFNKDSLPSAKEKESFSK